MKCVRIIITLLGALSVLSLISCGGGGTTTQPPPVTRTDILRAVTTWGYQIQELDATGAIDALAASTYQMLVLEPTRTFVGYESFDTAGMVSRLKSLPASAGGGRRLVVAYVDIGEAEDYRTYWQATWTAPTATQAGDPDFLITVDPDGWSGNYPTAYWDQRWKNIVLGGEGSLLDDVLDAGFDGIYMDWVEAYDDTAVIARATTDGVDTEQEMIQFVGEIRQTARQRDPEFLVIAQNAPDLAWDHPEYLQVIDAIAEEDLHFAGEADTVWGDPLSGDRRTLDGNEDWQRGWLYQRLDVYRTAGLPVFTCDYALIQANIDEAYSLSRARGYIPLVTQTPLSRLP